MTNEDLAKVFEEIADLLELREENTYRVVAYRNAVRELRATGYDVPALLAAGEALPKLPGIGAELTGGDPGGYASSTSGWGWGRWRSWSRLSGPGACAGWAGSAQNPNSGFSKRSNR